MQRAATSYFQTQVSTTSQSDVLLMLYDGAIKFLEQAKEFIEAKNPAQKGIFISKALDIINELDSTLKTETSPELVTNLHELYFFCSKHLLMANLKMNIKMIDEVIAILAGLRNAYAEIAKLPEVQTAVQEATNNMPVGAPSRTQAGYTSSGTFHNPVTPGTTARQHNGYVRTVQQATPLSAPTSTQLEAQSAVKVEEQAEKQPAILSQPLPVKENSSSTNVADNENLPPLTSNKMTLKNPYRRYVSS